MTPQVKEKVSQGQKLFVPAGVVAGSQAMQPNEQEVNNEPNP